MVHGVACYTRQPLSRIDSIRAFVAVHRYHFRRKKGHVMRQVGFAILLLTFCASGWGQSNYGPSGYMLERWDEDYSYLKTARSSDFFDPIKYIPLNASGDAYL